MLLRRTVAATTWPVTLTEAKLHLSLDGDEWDDAITDIIKTASDRVGEMAGRVMSQETWTAAFSAISGDLRLPKSPIIAVTGISYYDATDTATAATVSDFYLFQSDDYATLRPKNGVSWPTAGTTREDGITITFTAGYTTCPPQLKHAMKLWIGHLFANREAVVIGQPSAEMALAVESLVSDHRLRWYG